MDYEALAVKLAAKLAESHEHEARVTQGRKKANAFWQQFGDALTAGLTALNKAMQLEDAFQEIGSAPSSLNSKKERSVRTGDSVLDARMVLEAKKTARIEWRLRTEQNLDAPWVPLTVIGSPRGEAWVICYGVETSASALAERVLELLVNERMQAIDVSLEIDALRGGATTVES
jgi:hypothetical protein